MSSQTVIELTNPASAAGAQPKPDYATETGLPERELRKGTTAIIFITITGVTGISSLLAGLVVVALPRMGQDLHIPTELLLWPASIYALTCGCTLILAGAIADIVGSRFMYLLGCFLQSAFTLACGLSRNGFQLIFFRALAGIAIAFCLPSAVSLITTYFPNGKRRNLAFAAMGGGQPVGFSIGLTIGGVLVDGPGWRYGFYIASIINTIVLAIALWGLPRPSQPSQPISLHRLRTTVDWTGALLLSTSLALFSYVLAALTGSTTTIRHPATIASLTIALALVPTFIIWVHRQEKANKPAIIPNSLWRNRVFTSVCLSVFLMWGTFNAIENLLTFYFQSIQSLSATQTSLRFLPAPVVGLATNVLMGLVIHRLRPNWAVALSTSISAISPILIAIMKPQDPYWEYVLPAIALNAVGPDTLFTISNLVITAAFPDRTQALAGGVFNTVAQIGKSVGLALTAVIANSVTLRMEAGTTHAEKRALLEGYRAAWWFCLGVTGLAFVVGVWGLRNVGKLGLKRE